MQENDLGKDNAWVTYINPFRIIVPDGESPLNFELDEINSNTYNYTKLCRIVTTVDLLDLKEYKMFVCYDGALAIPVFGKYREKEKAVKFFNKIICQLQLSGILCEAIDQRDVVWGRLHKKVHIWPVNFGESASSDLHAKVRMRLGNNMDSIILNNPKDIKVSKLLSAFKNGESILKNIDNLTPSFLARGITEIRYKNWSLALSNLWISVEQLTDYLWKTKFIDDPDKQPYNEISSRIKTLKKDNRTWSTSVKQEILFQMGVFDSFVFERIYPARQARNRLVHDGKEVTEGVVRELFNAIVKLLELSVSDHEVCLQNLSLSTEMPVGKKLKIKENFNGWRDLSKGQSYI